MPLRRQRSNYQQFTEFERGHVIDVMDEKVGFSPVILQKDLAGMYSLCMIVESSGQGMILPQEDPVPEDHLALLTGKTAYFAYGCGASYFVRLRNSSGTVGTPVTKQTVKNRLLQGQLQARFPVACIPLTPICFRF
ncbi:uncharacterized protein TNCV_2445841 [Trichonephila clavipes]|nr:uncharacterized protein TNCV_2445841 [Trichonephila clavipes]